MKIRNARKEDAAAIGRGVTMALGDELPKAMAGENHSVQDVVDMFTALAAREDSQYSYLNTLVAEDGEGNVAGICVGYDGAKLYELREAFKEEASRFLGWEITEMGDETSDDEFYLDSLAVFPEFRSGGLGRRLLLERAEARHAVGKPAGLLVDYDNPKAEALYQRLGFIQKGERPFAGVVMKHYILP